MSVVLGILAIIGAIVVIIAIVNAVNKPASESRLESEREEILTEVMRLLDQSNNSLLAQIGYQGTTGDGMNLGNEMQRIKHLVTRGHEINVDWTKMPNSYMNLLNSNLKMYDLLNLLNS